MKYILLVADGMADYPLSDLNGRTPIEAARTPFMDYLAQHGMLGMTKNIPDTMAAGSDVATISILGYDPLQYYTGRGPLEAANLGVTLGEGDVAFRCNLVTTSGEALVDYSAGHISSEEALRLIQHLDKKLGTDEVTFYPGVSYRHLMVVREGARRALEQLVCRAPHDIIGEEIAKHLPQGAGAQFLVSLMEASREVLSNHEINHVRLDLKENPANMIWLWGQGKKPALPAFDERFGAKGAVISAVDLIKGLGRIVGLEVINVPGATGYYDTNYEGKAAAALRCLEQCDFVFVHVEAPDEAGHNGDLREKILAIERFDQHIVGALISRFKNTNDFRMMVLPDHATPLALRTHTRDATLFAVMGNGIQAGGFNKYCEKEAQTSPLFFERGHELMRYLISGKRPSEPKEMK